MGTHTKPPDNFDAIDAALDAAFRASPTLRTDDESCPPAPPARRKNERMYDPTESVFALYGKRMVALGWSIFPQERDSARRPATVDGRALKWGAYQDRLPTEAEVDSWSAQCPTHNIATISGAVSGGVNWLDVDASDPSLATYTRTYEVERIAHRVFGLKDKVQLRRTGRPPGFALALRCETDLKRVTSIDLGDGVKVELIAGGAPLTVYGKHHSLGKYFNWRGGEPCVIGPKDIPLVTAEQLEAFWAELCETYKVVRPTSLSATGVIEPGVYDKDARLVRPGNLKYTPGYQASPDGKVHDGRKTLVFHRAASWCRANPDMLGDDEGKTRLAIALFEELRAAYAEVPNDLFQTCREKVFQEAPKVDLTKLRRVVVDNETGKVSTVVRTAIEIGGRGEDLSFLPPPEKRKKLNIVERTAPDDDKATDRAIEMDPDKRDAGMAETSADIRRVIEGFLGPVHAGVVDRRVHLLRGGVGSGKSTQTMGCIQETKAARGRFPGPILFVTPTLANADEARVKAEALAKKFGEAGLVALPYKGKLAAGCLEPERLLVANSMGVGGQICRTWKLDKKGEREERTCEHYYVCPAIAQRAKIATADVIILATAYLKVAVPKELTDLACAVVIDESCVKELVHSKTFPLTTLDVGRAPPPVPKYLLPKGRVTRDQREVVSVGLLHDRDVVAAVAKAALREGKDPATEILPLKVGNLTGLQMVKAAKLVTGAVAGYLGDVDPYTSLEDLLVMAAAPKGSHMWEEHRLWSIIEDRILALMEDALAAEVAARGESVDHVRKAKGDRDARIQLLDPQDYVDGRQPGDRGYVGPSIRISWRTQANFAKLPTLLLDASANEAIVRKLFPKREVVLNKVTAPARVRTVAIVDRTNSTTSLLPTKNADAAGKIRAAKNLLEVRAALTAVSTLYGHGYVVAGMALSVQEAVNVGWKKPANLDFLHWNAIRGRDAYRDHLAAFSIGRNEMPARDVDGLVAALTYDDDTPETPIDALGTGRTADDKQLWPTMVTRALPCVDGSDMSLQVPEWAGYWAKIIQEQGREEELIQFQGRLRPVFNKSDVPPVWFAGSSVIPKGTVVHAVVSMSDIAACRGPLFEAIRRAGGVVDPVLTAASARDIDRNEIAKNMADITKDGLACRLGKALTRVSYTTEDDDTPRGTYVSSSVPDPVAAVHEACVRAGIFPEMITVGKSGAERVERADEVPLDEVETRLGPLEDRRHREETLRDEVRYAAADQVARLSDADRKRLGKGEVPSHEGEGWEPVSVDVRMILKDGG